MRHMDVYMEQEEKYTEAVLSDTDRLQSKLQLEMPSCMSSQFSTPPFRWGLCYVPIISIIHDPSLATIVDDHMRFLATMRAIQGALKVASSVQIILGYSQLWAICSRFFSPVGMVPVIALAGFGLFDRGFPLVWLLY
ncbi:hypothetical protein L2E82_12197 [Cichorium intybus]|uniref:Uncharacterized protein n=1 Tax=Cichorium intybus TaxID=13427 RepID=A0ACB9GGJ0_CICIN|nr:hypothetical protein L2E82_12197 [Cichorium intybus]